MSQSDTNPFQEASESLDEQDSSSYHVDLLTVRKKRENSDGEDDSGYPIGRINIDDSLAKDLSELVVSEVTTKAESLNDNESELEIVPYDIANKNRDQDILQTLSFNEISESEQFSALISSNSFSEDSLETTYDLKFLAIKLNHSEIDNDLIAFQSFTRGQIISMNRRLLISAMQSVATDNQEPVYNAEIEDTVYQIPYRIDAVCVNRNMYVFDQRRFENIFNYHDMFRESADEVMSNLEDMDVPVDGLEHIEKAYQDFPAAARTFYDIKNTGEYKNIDQEGLEYLYENFSPKSIVEKDGEYQIEATDRFDIWDILRVLNDSHLNSTVTESRYVSHSKDSVSDT